MRKKEIILLVLIIFLGIGLRSVEVLNKNFLFGFDQGRDYLAVRKIVVEKKPTLIGSEVGAGMAGLQYIFHGPYYYYSLIIPFLLFKGDPYGGLVLMFLFGVASLFLCFYITRKIFDVKTALITTFLLSICPSITSQSRFMWNSHPTTFFILLAFWFTFKIFENPLKYFFLASFWAGLIYGFELAISVPLIITQFLYVWLILKVKRRKIYLFGALGAFLSHLPFFIFEVRHGLMATKSILAIVSGVLRGESSVDTATLFASHLVNFWHNFQNTFVLSGSWSFLLLVAMLLITHEIVRGEKAFHKQPFVKFLLLLPLVSFAVFMFIKTAVWDFYLIHLHLAYIFLFVGYLTQLKWSKAKLLLIAFLLLMTPGVFKEINRARYDYGDFGGTAKIKGKIQTIDYIYQDAQGEKFNVLIFTPPVYDYAYHYLLTWYGGKKYGYVPGGGKEGLFYLWIEPDLSKPSSYKGWLETVIKTGEVLKEEKLPNGFIVQKRYAEKE